MQATHSIYQEILESKAQNKKLLAILLDPDKINWQTLKTVVLAISQSAATHLFIGGSRVQTNQMDELIVKIRLYFKELNCKSVPIILFPGNPSQISNQADGILFLSLLSGRNPDFLIEHQVNAAPILQKTQLEIIPTAYILIESGNPTAVATVSNTKPLDRNNSQYAMHTALAGQMLGHKLVYLEAGSGAKQAVPLEMIKRVAQNIQIPLIVGGGIIDLPSIQKAYQAGADMVVIGTAFENNIDFFILNTAQNA